MLVASGENASLRMAFTINVVQATVTVADQQPLFDTTQHRNGDLIAVNKSSRAYRLTNCIAITMFCSWQPDVLDHVRKVVRTSTGGGLSGTTNL